MNYKKGYIVTYGNDTINGLIEIKSKSDQNKEFEFLRNNSSESEILSPYEIKSIKTDDRYYVSKEVSLNDEKKVIFIEVIFEGVFKGYFLNNNNFFIEKEDSLYHLSQGEKEVIDKYGDVYYLKSKQYLGMITYLINDEPLLIEELEGTKLTSKALVKIFREYCEKTCSECSFIDYSKERRHNVFIEPQIGLIYATLRFPTSDDFDTYLAPIAGINFHIPSLKNYKWGYMVGINYSYNKFKGDYTHSIFNKEETYRVILNYSALSIPLIIEYSFTDKKIQPTLKLGYNSVFILNQDNSLGRLLLGQVYYSLNERSELRSYQYGFIAGGGFKYRINNKSFLHLNCNFEFQAPSINAHYFYDKQKTFFTQINAGYSFKIK